MPVKKSRPENKKPKTTKKTQSKTKKTVKKKVVSKRKSTTKEKKTPKKKIQNKTRKIDKETKEKIQKTLDVLPEMFLMSEKEEQKYQHPVVNPLEENKKKLQTQFDWTATARRQKLLWSSVLFMSCIIFVMWIFNTKIVLKKIRETPPSESLIAATKQSFEASKNDVFLIEKQNAKRLGEPVSSPEEQLKNALTSFLGQIQTPTTTTSTIATTTEPLMINP